MQVRNEQEVSAFIKRTKPLAQASFDNFGACPAVFVIEDIHGELLTVATEPNDFTKAKKEFAVAFTILLRMLGNVKSATLFLEATISKPNDEQLKKLLSTFNQDIKKVQKYVMQYPEDYASEGVMVMHDQMENSHLCTLEIDRSNSIPIVGSTENYKAHLQPEQIVDFDTRFNSLFYKTTVFDTILNKAKESFPDMTDKEMVIRFAKVLAPNVDTKLAYQLAEDMHRRLTNGAIKVEGGKVN